MTPEERLKWIEFERDILAEALAWGAGKDKRPLYQHLPWMDAKEKWLKYAYKEARRRLGYPVPPAKRNAEAAV